MITLRVMLKNGQEFSVKCEKCNIDQTEDGMVNSCEMEGIVENKPIYLDFSQVAAIVHVMSDEPACTVKGFD